MKSELTGRKVFAITASAFTVIIGVNVVMAVQAVRTFPGLEVRNSYVASQSFEAERAAQEALGWTLTDSYADGELRLSFRDAGGLPVKVEGLSATIGRTTEAASDIVPEFAWRNGDYIAPADLAPGKWMVLLEAFAADGTRFHQRLDMFVSG
ncbi:MAG: FixH family protein [Albidovulum sp.]|uniref:FixH family protein n=1 Tax=Albidovulum sp. TaxID=1872424 RepID=UPI003C9975F1